MALATPRHHSASFSPSSEIACLNGSYVYGSVDTLPIHSPELDAAEHEMMVIRTLAIESAALLYSFRFDSELDSFLADPLAPLSPKTNKGSRKSSKRPVGPERQASSSGWDYLLGPPIWIGPHTSRPTTPSTLTSLPPSLPQTPPPG